MAGRIILPQGYAISENLVSLWQGFSLSIESVLLVGNF